MKIHILITKIFLIIYLILLLPHVFEITVSDVTITILI